MKNNAHRDARLLRQIKLSNILSFGPETPPLEMDSLNVLIGANGSGKSNLVEALALMRATPLAAYPNSDAHVAGVLRLGGGPAQWIWKGAPARPASIELLFNSPNGKPLLSHLFAFRADKKGFRLYNELVAGQPRNGAKSEPRSYYRFDAGRPKVNGGTRTRKLDRQALDQNLSILAQLREPKLYPEITRLAKSYERWRLYREWTFGRDAAVRDPQKADMRNDRLEEDLYNMALILRRLCERPETKVLLRRKLFDVYDGVDDFYVRNEGGNEQVYLTEGNFSIPAIRLSDGTLRYLFLLIILCDPEPPPLICIEEPELGLHPDLLPGVADLLQEASKRTQIIVTTHSDILVDSMTERPEAVVVFEKHDGKTEMSRLSRGELSAWLEKYRLGQLWTQGQLGGTRW